MIENEENEVACAECQNIIVHLYLTEAALPFYKLDKLTFYNAAVNMYSQFVVNNNIEVVDFFKDIITSNVF